mmetsp:Transcript_18065/g.22212  ORF Transcript_18065/g.22212 Transcript_18065/m.22212 type:complete len:226 (+) Transcript_18065:168-845(+)|eukprot:CAMPEP_0204833388 /NCGR_PEP_ID=MMETSP1346-20131115/16645_1 /ASSEMBLY_ACC=CAM_ASM_000771 /TAXON_ID=215587 /ORGANISM="Aplanochytrium stocchinoi, Strain GSBS06" /LENGTH=225 /DNA_ID=CAMNT_0051965879 /DNA_START=90 /DNA_END=767 /DNA_ORIENTATION=+
MGRRRRLSQLSDDSDSGSGSGNDDIKVVLSKRGRSLTQDGIKFAKKNQTFVFGGFLGIIVVAMLIFMLRSNRSIGTSLLDCEDLPSSGNNEMVRCRVRDGYELFVDYENPPEYLDLRISNPNPGAGSVLILSVVVGLSAIVGLWFWPAIRDYILENVKHSSKAKSVLRESKYNKRKADKKSMQSFEKPASKNRRNYVSDVSDTDYDYSSQDSVDSYSDESDYDYY